ncbi:Intermediate filament protein ifa-4, partial [Clarias magur]
PDPLQLQAWHGSAVGRAKPTAEEGQALVGLWWCQNVDTSTLNISQMLDSLMQEYTGKLLATSSCREQPPIHREFPVFGDSIETTDIAEKEQRGGILNNKNHRVTDRLRGTRSAVEQQHANCVIASVIHFVSLADVR